MAPIATPIQTTSDLETPIWALAGPAAASAKEHIIVMATRCHLTFLIPSLDSMMSLASADKGPADGGKAPQPDPPAQQLCQSFYAKAEGIFMRTERD
jgi:hypothetical protein